MARPWRLRHKLFLLLGLVLAAVGLLLAGTVFGLTGYRATVRSTRATVDELQVVHQLQAAVGQVAAGRPDLPREAGEGQLDFERRRAADALAQARLVVAGFRLARAAHRPADDGEESALVAEIDAGLADLGRLLADPPSRGLDGPDGYSGSLLGAGTRAGQAHADLAARVTALHGYLIDDVRRAAERAEWGHTRSLVVAGAAAVVALVLLGTLLHYFRVWVSNPVRHIQAGVRRVRAGEFDRPIRLTGDDELTELAAEFDAMTARLKEVNADLHRQVSERTRQLVRSEKMVSVGFLAAGVAHEINNPLASIAFCAEALEGRLNGLLGRAPASEAEVVFKYLGMMQEEAQRCKEITHRLLDFARGGGQREPADLSDIVRAVVGMTELTPNARGKAIRFADPGPVVATVSGPEIKSVVLNIVVNALDSMDAGGRLDIQLAERNGAAELRFSDTGCGMAAETLNNIFEPFFTKSKTGHGTGLGLSISHQIVDQHGGTVTATSPGPGRGSTFVVRLPLGAAASAPRPALAAAA